MADLTTIAAVCGQVPELSDNSADAWLAGAISAVSAAIEARTGRWLAPRGAMTLYFDSPGGAAGFHLPVPKGLQSITAIATAWLDQPDDGSGVYTPITTGYYLQPAVQDRLEGWPATSIDLSYLANAFFYPGLRTTRVSGQWGWASTPPRVAQIATTAVVRAWRARTSGGADYAIIGPDGGMKVLRDLAPAELEELDYTYRDVVAH